jgi:hypothetical protein
MRCSKRLLFALLAAPLGLILWAMSLPARLAGRWAGEGEIEYRGETFKTTITYFDYDDYKNDPNNIAQRELPRIESLILGARFDREYADRATFMRDVFDYEFPGYRGGSILPFAQGRVGGVDWPEGWCGMALNIPGMRRSRFLIASQQPNGTWRVVDDFVFQANSLELGESSDEDVYTVEVTGAELVYRSPGGKTVRRKPFVAP